MGGINQLFTGMRSSATALTAERTRVDIIAENIANARTTRTETGSPYRRKLVMFEPVMGDSDLGPKRPTGVAVTKVVEDYSPFQRILEPTHPDADSDGMVSYPNINVVMEMADLITSLRAYEANLTAQENFMRMAQRALELAR